MTPIPTPVREPVPYPFTATPGTLAEARTQLRICLRGDLARQKTPAAVLTLTIWRAGQALYRKRGVLAFLLRRVVGLADALWTRGVIGAELPKQVLAGPGLRLPHAGRGVIIHPSCVLGAGVTIYHQVTLGIRTGPPYVGPVIGDRAYLGVGARVLGDVVIGAGTTVGANALVLTSTDPGSTWVGPAAHEVARAVERDGTDG